MQYQQHSRRYVLVTPSTVGENPDVLLYFHGSLQSGSVARRFTAGSFDELAERTGTLVVYPDGIDRHFNDARATLPVKARELGIDDVGFSRAIVEELRAEFGIGRVFACGYSNGGQMTLRLLFDAPGFLSAAAIFASTLGEGENHAPDNPDSAFHPTPVMLMHGTKDPLVPYEGGVAGFDAQRTRGRVEPAVQTAQRLSALNRGEHDPHAAAAASAAPEITRPYADTELRRWNAETAAPPVELWTVENMGHVVPCGKEMDPRLGPTTESFIAAEIVQEFFGLKDRQA